MGMIAIIGGIGSGKSSVLQHISDLGKRTCDCDEIYRQISKEQEFIDLVGKTFGVVEDGEINKKALGEIIFNDGEQLKKLNGIAHPLVFGRLEEIFRGGEGDMYVEVSAFDKSMVDKFDAIIYVKTQKQNQIQRVKLRNGWEEDYITSVIAKQMSAQEMESVADFVIVNDGDIQHLLEQVEWIIGWM
ncbi:MAG: dephospho-CoA kinase [Clostridia bacterium]|nr:dephospho-CoA kinase [Clostridia bacterium]